MEKNKYRVSHTVDRFGNRTDYPNNRMDPPKIQDMSQFIKESLLEEIYKKPSKKIS